MAGNHPEDEAFRLVFGASPLVPDEAEEIEPVLKLPPVDVRMGPQEPFEESVDLVYGLHRVVFVRKALRALDLVDGVREMEGVGHLRVASVAVVDPGGALRDPVVIPHVQSRLFSFILKR